MTLAYPNLNLSSIRTIERSLAVDPSYLSCQACPYSPQDIQWLHQHLTQPEAPDLPAVEEFDEGGFTPEIIAGKCRGLYSRLERLGATTKDVPDQLAIAKNQTTLLEKLVELAERSTALAAPSEDVSILNKLSKENRQQLLLWAEKVYREGDCPLVFTFGPDELHAAARKAGPKAIVDWVMSQTEAGDHVAVSRDELFLLLADAGNRPLLEARLMELLK